MQDHFSSPNTTYRPILIGLTGGIASGKSLAARYFGDRDVPLIDADQIARELVLPGQAALKEIIQVFGSDAGSEDTGLDRAFMRQRVFSDDNARKKLENILHPAIRANMFSRALSLTEHYVVLEIPLLVENKLNAYVDRVLVVDCSVETQIARLAHRDQENPNTIKALIDSQATREERLSVAHDVILNEQDLGTLEQCVDQLHQVYMRLTVETISRYPGIRLP